MLLLFLKRNLINVCFIQNLICAYHCHNIDGFGKQMSDLLILVESSHRTPALLSLAAEKPLTRLERLAWIDLQEIR